MIIILWVILLVSRARSAFMRRRHADRKVRRRRRAMSMVRRRDIIRTASTIVASLWVRMLCRVLILSHRCQASDLHKGRLVALLSLS